MADTNMTDAAPTAQDVAAPDLSSYSKILPSRDNLLKRSPWRFEQATGEVLACGERLTSRERKLVLLASRYPSNFDSATGAAPKKSRKDREWNPSTGWERDLVLVALEYPLDLATMQSLTIALPPNTSQPAVSSTTVSAKISSVTRLPSRTALLKRAPWLLERATNDLFACVERLTDRERRLVLLASNHPNHYDAEGASKMSGKKDRNWWAETGWERDLVLAALKYPVDMVTVEDTWRYVKNKPQPHTSSTYKPSPLPQRPSTWHNKATQRISTSIQQQLTTTQISPPTSSFILNPDNMVREVPHPPKGYAASQSYHFRDLKKRILSNAHAYYAHRFPQASQFDFITSSTTPTGRLDSTEYRGALIVYPDPKSHNWQLLYKSNACPTVEDAAFEVKYWVEEDMANVFEKMEAGDVWAADVKTTVEPPKKNGVGAGGEVKMEGVKKTGEKGAGGEGEGGKAITDRSASPETVAGENDEAKEKDKGKLPAPRPQTTTGGNTNLKRKARDYEDEERAKSRKNEEEERVFVREKGPSPVSVGKKEVLSLFGSGGDKKKPDMTPVKLKLPEDEK